MKSLKPFWLLILLLLSPSGAQAAKEAHGGYVVVCGDQIEVLDFLEGFNQGMKLPVLSKTDWGAGLGGDLTSRWYGTFVEQSESHYPIDSNQVQYDLWNEYFTLSSQTNPVAESQFPTANEDWVWTIRLPSGCKIQQVAGWRDGSVNFYVLQRWYERLSARVKGELLFHEAIYRLCLVNPAICPDYLHVRRYVSFLALIPRSPDQADPVFSALPWVTYATGSIPSLPGQLPGKH